MKTENAVRATLYRAKIPQSDDIVRRGGHCEGERRGTASGHKQYVGERAQAARLAGARRQRHLHGPGGPVAADPQARRHNQSETARGGGAGAQVRSETRYSS